MKAMIKKILNILFFIVVGGSIIYAWDKEIDDPNAWFPNFVEEKAEKPAAPTKP